MGVESWELGVRSWELGGDDDGDCVGCRIFHGPFEAGRCQAGGDAFDERGLELCVRGGDVVGRCADRRRIDEYGAVFVRLGHGEGLGVGDRGDKGAVPGLAAGGRRDIAMVLAVDELERGDEVCLRPGVRRAVGEERPGDYFVGLGAMCGREDEETRKREDGQSKGSSNAHPAQR